MPADQKLRLPIGVGGLNLRDSPAELSTGDLTDTLNWRIDPTGALVKRLGMAAYSVNLGQTILELFALQIAGGNTYLLAHAADGHVYSTTDGLAWTSIDSGLSTTDGVGWFQYLDKVYWCDGSHDWRIWDGTTKTTDVDMPHGTYATIWRNRAFIIGTGANSRTVYWSKAGDATDFTTYVLNTVAFPDDTELTGIHAAPNIGSGSDGADGVIVFSKGRIHRIYDDTDNTAGAISGGSNVLVDAACGCMSHRSIVSLRGRTFFLARDGVYSTDGHGQAKSESKKIAALFPTMAWGQSQRFVGIAWDGRYWLAYAPTGSSENTRMLELAPDLPGSEGQSPWMAHDMPIRSWVAVDSAAGPILYGADASSNDRGYVRRLFTGGFDVDGDSSQSPIAATCRTGAQLLGTQQIKRIRRIEVLGRGAVTLGAAVDLEQSAGESRTLDMRSDPGAAWGAMTWGSFTWGARTGPVEKHAYYSKRGRYFQFTLSESSSDSSTKPRSLGYAGGEDGGAAAYSVILKITPLDSD